MTGRRLLTGAFALVALGFVVYGAYAWYRSTRQVSTDDAYVEGPVAAISAKVPGQVIELHFRENQAVTKGDLLIRIDPRDFVVKMEQARAAVAIADSRYRAGAERVALARARAQSHFTQEIGRAHV